ncbi:fibroblast growth factor receptor 2-like isoform X2 [Montipora foliosa]|uniref:fibroblast growth factor receptor 2-like isoform X2 n=1 Tax=Montipora foliosa TaxID=591990 RepID=UPI0035F158F1
MDFARSNIIFLICLVFAATFPDVEALTTSGSVPSFTLRPQNKSVNVHSSVILKCEASGIPQPTITWVKYADSGATMITTGGRFNVNSGYLDIMGVQLVDSGQYRCIAQNKHGKLVADTFLTIITYGPPTWKTKPHNVTLYDGQHNYKLDCQAYGFPPVRHRWTKNGSQINDEDVSIGRNDLSFRVAHTRHIGWYTCIANNVHGTIMQSVYVDVVNDPSIIIQPESASVVRRKSVTLSCGVVGSISRVVWFKNNERWNESVRVTETSKRWRNLHIFSLTIEKVRKRHRGKYHCVVTNAQGRTESDVARVSLTRSATPLSVIAVEPFISTTEGSDVELECIFNDNMTSGITWYKDGVKLTYKGDGVIVNNKHKAYLRLTQVAPSVAGKYVCKGSSPSGSTEANISLVVKGETAPNVKPLNQIQMAKTLSSATLKFVVVAFTPPVVLLYKDGERLHNATYSTWYNYSRGTFLFGFTIPSVQYNDSGFYTCFAQNRFGVSSGNVSLIVKGIPDAPTNVRVKNLSPGVVQVSWVPEFDGGATCWFNVQFKKSGESEWTSVPMRFNTTRAELRNSDDWNGMFVFRVTAVNHFGASVPRTVSVELKGIPDAPTNVTVKNLSPSVVLISWVPEFDGGATCWFNVQFKKSQKESEWTVPMRINTTTAELKNPDGWDGMFVFRVTAVNQFGSSVPRTVSVKLKENKNNGQQKQREDGSSSTGALVGGVIGGVVFVALVIVMVFVLRRQKRKSTKTPQKQLPAVAYAVVDQENNIYATTDATDANVYTTDANVDTTANPQQRSDTYSYASIKLDAAAAMATGQLEYASVQKPKQWELPKSNVRLDKKLGSGHFGQVMKGFLKTKQGTRVVAVKMLKENADQQQKKEFLAELELMKTMSPHPNIVGLVGCCTKSGEPFIIVEYCSLGNLRDFLRSSHGSVIYANLAANSLTLTCLDLLSFAWQCARGMSYLASQKVVHRDLAARNILVDKGHVCKIADFGLARDIYEKKQYLKLGEADLPLRWMAIESIFQGITTTLSDVWSFGILLWEIVTLGANPYPAMKRDDLIEQLRVGYRMPKPPFCSDELYAIMWQCWQTDPESRPTFLEIGKTLHRLKTAQTLPIDLGNYDRSYINATEDD